MRAERPMFDNRQQAGKMLARQLANYRGRQDLVVLSISREGLEVAFPIAKELKAPMDLVISKLVTLPQEPETAFGAVTQDIVILNDVLVAQWGIDRDVIRHLAQGAKDDAWDEMFLARGNKPPPDLSRKTVIIADDGMGVGFPIVSSVVWAKKANPKQIIVAVPVAPLFEIDRLNQLTDEVVCLVTPDAWGLRIATFYRDWEEPSDAEIKSLIEATNTPDARKPRKKTA